MSGTLNFGDKTPLHYLCLSGDLEGVRELLNNGADTEAKDYDGLTALHFACLGGHRDVAEVLLNNCSNISVRDSNGATPLFVACENGHLETAAMLIDIGTNKMLADNTEVSFDEDFEILLQVACYNMNSEVVKLLLDRYSYTGEELNSALVYASECDNIEAVKLLLSSCTVADYNNCGNTALHCVCNTTNNSDLARLLIESGSDINILDNFGKSPLHYACKRSLYEIVRLLISMEANTNILDYNNETPIYYAKTTEIATELINSGANLQVTNKDYETPLHKVVVPQIAKIMIDNGADVQSLSTHNMTPLHSACKLGLFGVAKILVENNSDINAEDRDKLTPLHYACFVGDKEMVIFLASKGAKLESRDRIGRTPLHLSCLSHQAEIVKFLLSISADPNTKNISGETLLHIICTKEYADIYEILVAHKDTKKEEKEPVYGNTPIHSACYLGSSRIVDILTKSGVSTELRSKDDYTPLHIVSSNCKKVRSGVLGPNYEDNLSTARLLISRKADLLAKDKDGMSPLHHACNACNHNMIELLIENGADISQRDNEGNTPIFRSLCLNDTKSCEKILKSASRLGMLDVIDNALYGACYGGYVDIVSTLISKGGNVKSVPTSKSKNTLLHNVSWIGRCDIANVLIREGVKIDVYNIYDHTPLHIACMVGFLELTKLLISNGAKIEAEDASNNTPLILAVYNNLIDIVSLLLENSACVNVRSKDGRTALHIACERGFDDLAVLLIRYGADIKLKDGEGRTPIHTLAQRDNFPKVHQSYPFSVQFPKGVEIEVGDKDGNTPLHIVSQLSDTDSKHILYLSGDSNIDLRNNRGETALHLACDKLIVQNLSGLISSGANVNIQDNNGNSPLHVLCGKSTSTKEGELPKSIKLVKKNTISTNSINYNTTSNNNVGQREPRTPGAQGDFDNFPTPREIRLKSQELSVIRKVIVPSIPPCVGGNTEIKDCVTLLVACSASINMINRDGHTPLHLACLVGSLDIVLLLAEMGANTLVRDPEGNTMLHLACLRGHKKIAEAIINGGAIISIRNYKNNTPLHFACLGGHTDIVSLLTSMGAETNVKNDNGDTPLHRACRGGHHNIVELLKGEINEKNNIGNTPVHCACLLGYLSTFLKLSNIGADISIKNDKGLTPSDIAQKGNYTRIIKRISLSKKSEIPSPCRLGIEPYYI